MRKFKFDSEVLNTLKDTPNSGVEAVLSKKHLALHPIHLNDFKKSVHDLLNEDVAKYIKELDGILLGYENIKLLSAGGFIHMDSCYIHIDIEASFFVFRPKVGEVMNGIVTRKSKDHVGVLVYNIFNVSIPSHNEEQDHWMGKDVHVGSEVSFRIVFFTMTSFMPYIRGQLVSIVTKNYSESPIQDMDETVFPKYSNELVEELPPCSKKNKKSKKERRESKVHDDEDDDVALHQISSISEDMDLSPSKAIKKNKKHKRKSNEALLHKGHEIKIKEEQTELFNTHYESGDLEPKKQKRKRKLSISDDTEYEMGKKKKKNKH